MSGDYRSMYDARYIGAWDLNDKDVTVTIERVEAETLKNRQGSNKKPVLYFKGSKKGFALNKTNGATIAAMYGPKVKAWAGKRITLYATVAQFGSNEVEAIRVRNRIPPNHKDEPLDDSGPMDEAMRERQEQAAIDAQDAQEQEGEVAHAAH